MEPKWLYDGCMTANYTLRIPDDLYQQIKQAAERGQRSIHGEILWLISQGLQQEAT